LRLVGRVGSSATSEEQVKRFDVGESDLWVPVLRRESVDLLVNFERLRQVALVDPGFDQDVECRDRDVAVFAVQGAEVA
jgi:hypothetical protein